MQGCETASGSGKGKAGRGFREGKGEGRVRVSGRKGKAGGFWREFARARGAFGRRERERLGAGFRAEGKAGWFPEGVCEGAGDFREEGKEKAGRFQPGRGERRKTPAPCKGRALESGGGG